MWKTVLIVAGILFLLAFTLFLYLLIAGADESRKAKNASRNKKNVKEI